MKGLVHIYTGDGKGKTTAALGLCIRASGSDKRILFVQFLKASKTGELKILSQLHNVKVYRPEAKVKGFVWELNENEKLIMCKSIETAYNTIVEELQSGIWDIVVLDEIIGCIKNGFISDEQIIELIRNKPEAVELILTGRNAPERLIELADYVSEIKAVKHPYQSGIPARKGVEF